MQPVPDANFESVTDIIPAIVRAEASDSEVAIARVPSSQAVQDVTASAAGTKSLAMLDCGNRCCDAGLWTELTKEDIAYWAAKGPEECQNASGSFQSSRRSYHHVSHVTKTRDKDN